MGILKTVLKAFPALVLVGCSQTVAPNSPLDKDSKIFSESATLGILQSTEGLDRDLDGLAQSATILVFASDTCTTCAHEVLYWRDIFKNGQPTNIYFAHVLIGGNHQDALDWKDLYEINWDVLLERNDELYRKHCPAIITPCFIVRNNLTKKLIQTYEVLNQAKLEEITGPWIF